VQKFEVQKFIVQWEQLYNFFLSPVQWFTVKSKSYYEDEVDYLHTIASLTVSQFKIIRVCLKWNYETLRCNSLGSRSQVPVLIELHVLWKFNVGSAVLHQYS